MTREEAIERLNNAKGCPLLYDSHVEAIEMAISALEQEPCDDAISRDAVLKVIDGWYEQNRDTENIEDLIILITYMGNVQPQTVCDDVVSRAEVKRIVDFYKEQYDGIYHINESIDKLPSVQPSRKGHWIIKDRYYHDTITAECSECGREVEIPTCMSELMYKGCPYCLADMRGTENESKG